MRDCNHRRLRQRIRFLRHEFLQDGGLPFTDVYSAESVEQAVTAVGLVWNDAIYTALVTLAVFLGQILSSDHSCRGAVARLISHRLSHGLPACSSKTGAYCQARKRFSERFVATIAGNVGRKLEDQAEKKWLWKGHHVHMFDGTMTLISDTTENREAYPRTHNQNEGLPLARVAAVFSLSCGVLLDLMIAKYAGKGQREVTLLRLFPKMFSHGDDLLADCLMCNWRNIFELSVRGDSSHFETQ